MYTFFKYYGRGKIRVQHIIFSTLYAMTAVPSIVCIRCSLFPPLLSSSIKSLIGAVVQVILYLKVYRCSYLFKFAEADIFKLPVGDVGHITCCIYFQSISIYGTA